MAINFPNDPATNPGNGGQWTDPGGSGTWEVEIINGEAIWTLVSNSAGNGSDGSPVALNDLNDVTLSSPQDTNVLQYNAASGKWINAPAPSAGNVNLNDLGDVDTSAGTEGDVLVKQADGNWAAQTPANNGGIGEAPEDGTPYVRQDASWISLPDQGGTLNIDEAPADDVAYTRKNNAWVPGVEAVSGSTAQIEGDNNIDTGTNTRAVATGQVLTYDGTKFAPAALPADNVGIGEAPNDGKQYGRQSEGWTEITATGGGPATTDDLTEGSTNKYFPEAPTDGKQYARQSEGWTEVAASGGGGGIDEAPEDGGVYGRSNGGWADLTSQGGLSYGKLSTSSESQVVAFEDTAAATAAGYTQVTLSANADDGNTGVQLPASFNNTSWFDVQDPSLGDNGYQTIWVNGNGYAAFMTQALATSAANSGNYPDYVNGYDPTNSYTENIPLLFGFICCDMIPDMICTKEVGDWFVIRIQWLDQYNYIKTTPGRAGEIAMYPYAAYNPNAAPIPASVGAKTKTAAEDMITVELWLGVGGGVKMLYADNTKLLSLVEDSVSIGQSRQTNGIFKAGTPVTEVMGSAISFNTFDDNPLIYSPADTLDGTVNTEDVLDWYISLTTTSTLPFITDAPKDGTVYGRQDGAWVEAAGAGSGAVEEPIVTSHREQSGRTIAYGLSTAYPFGQWRTIGLAIDPYEEQQIPRSPNLTASSFFVKSETLLTNDGNTGEQGYVYITKENDKDVIRIHRQDLSGNDWIKSTISTATFAATSTDSFYYDDYAYGLPPQGGVFIFANATFWRNYPDKEVKWQKISVDAYIPMDTSTNPSAVSGYFSFYPNEAYFGTGENDVKSFFDFFGCTEAEFTGQELRDYKDANGSYPAEVANDPQAASGNQLSFLTLFTLPVDDNLDIAPDDNTFGGGGYYTKAASELPNIDKEAAKKKQTPGLRSITPDVGNGESYSILGPGQYKATNGMIPVFRGDLVNDMNIGYGSSGSGSGPPARYTGTREDYPEWLKNRELKKEEFIAKRLEEHQKESPSPKVNMTNAGKKNASGFGWKIPWFDEQTSDPRQIWDYCIQNRNPNSGTGILTYDRLAWWDLYGFDTFIKNVTPAAGETIVWDANEGYWTYSSEASFKLYGQKAKDNPGYAKVMDIIKAVQADPELKAALKAALAD